MTESRSGTRTPIDWRSRLPLIAILRGITPTEVVDHVAALVDAGFEAIEVPLNSPAWEDSIARTLDRFGGSTLIGGGTVLRAADVDRLAGLGARLAVTPNTRPALIEHAVAAGLEVVAGFATPSEAFDAIDAGAQALKLFPATTCGPGFVRAVRAVLPPSLPLFAVGGITPDNLADYVAAGCLGAGLGSDLYRPGQPVAQTVERARRFVAACRAAGGSSR